MKLLLVTAIYIALMALAARHPDIDQDDPQTETELLPRPRDMTVTGLYYLLPIFVLVWNILVDRLSPSFSTYWATLTMIAIVFTQHPLKALFRGKAAGLSGQTTLLIQELKQGLRDFIDGMIAGARNMIGIAVASGAAGVIIGTVSLIGSIRCLANLLNTCQAAA